MKFSTPDFFFFFFFFQLCIVIQEVFPDGVVAKDSRLLPGDQLLEVRQTSFKKLEIFIQYSSLLIYS